ncbi:MAG TPA: tetratricopeptide repeat protein [Kiritimatiellia bacterium]|nr:tetratricopeptide repeat protein [Kiritimatiellia bacterium]
MKNNPLVYGLTVQNIQGIFTSYVTGNYIPLTLLSFAINYELAGMHPWIFHFTNVLLHTMNVLLAFYVLFRLTGDARLAWFAVAFFGLHPLRVESVAWITERKDVLFAFFYLGSLTSWLIFRDTGNRRAWTIALGLFICSGLAKQQAVSLPVILLLVDWYTKRLQRRTWPALLPFFILAAGFAIIAVFGQWTADSLKAGPMFSPLHRALLASHSLGFYMGKQIWPYPLSAVYEFPANVIAHSAFSPLLTITICGLFIWFCRRNRDALFAGGFFFITLLPMLNLFPAGTQVVADRFTYLPSIGAGMLVALLADRIVKISPSNRRLRWGVRGVLIVGLATLATATSLRNRVWQNSYTLWSSTLRVMPESYTALLNLTAWHLNHDEPEEAMTLAERLVDIHPDLADGYMIRGLVHQRSGNVDAALADLTRALVIDPNEPMLYLHRSSLFEAKGMSRKAIQDIQRAIELNPRHAHAWHDLGTLHASNHQYLEAIAAFTQVLTLQPGQPDALFNRARALELSGQPDAALRDINELLSLAPGQLNARYQRMLIFKAMKNFPGARHDARYLIDHHIEVPKEILDAIGL